MLQNNIKIRGGFNMEKDKRQNDLNFNLQKKTNEETLEISSTGYGFEYVTNKTEEEQKSHHKK